jgi:hypothetical protein
MNSRRECISHHILTVLAKTKGAFLGGCYLHTDIIAFGGIPVSGTRSSETIKGQPHYAAAPHFQQAHKTAQDRDRSTIAGTNLSS